MPEDAHAITVAAALAAVRDLLARYTFVAPNEADLQRQVHAALGTDARFAADREVIAERGRYDILVRFTGPRGVATVVLELKVRGAAAAVERQAQRYAKTAGVDAVAVVTTSQRLAHALLRPRGGSPNTLGGKPFRAFTLRAF